MASESRAALERIGTRLTETHGELVGAAAADGTARKQLEDVALEAVVRQLRMRPGAARRLARDLIRELVGFGPLEDLLQDPEISEIMVNGHRQIFVERGGRLAEAPAHFRDEDHLLNIIRRMVRRLGRRLDRASPAVDGRLPDGSRFHAIIPPLVLQGVVLTIRRFPEHCWHAADLCQRGTWNQATMDFLVAAVKARLNILIAGATGAGKSTALAALLNSAVEPTERVITIEEAVELRLDHQHLISMEARSENSEGRGEVTIRHLLRNALRMRPDRIIIGEVRGGEAFELLQALNTGHRGSLSTVHANGTLDALHRFENMALMAPEPLPHRVLRQQVAQAVDLVLHLRRSENGQRQLTELAAVTLSPSERTWRLQSLVRREGDELVQPAPLPALTAQGLAVTGAGNANEPPPVVGLLTLALAPLADLSSGFRPLGGGRLAALLTRRDRPQVTAGETVSARRRWMPLEEAVLYEVVEGMAARLQAGQVADQALDGAVRELEGPLGRDLRHAVRRHQRGTPLAAALVEVRGPAHVLRQLGETLAIVEETGGHLGTALGHILQGFRERRRLVGILRIRTAEARYALQLMAILPLLLVLYLVGAHPHVLVPLWSEATGRLSSAYALGSWASGIWLMRGLVLPERYL